MKKNLRKTFAKATALAMAVAMMVSVVPANSADAKAKKPKLAKSVKVTVKKTKKVKIKNTKKIKKTKWSIKSKKVATISKKKKTSVVVKGKKAGKSTTLTAKVTLKGKKKALKLKCKVKVMKKVTPTPKPIKDTTFKNGDVTLTVSEKDTVHIPLTELNETILTSESKMPPLDPEGKTGPKKYAREDAIFNRDGSVTFTSNTDYNSGMSFYLNPCTDEKDLTDLTESKQAGYFNFRKGEKDMSAYDYIRIKLTSDNEMNLRTYNGIESLEISGALTDAKMSETYEGGWIGPAKSDEYMVSDDGVGMKVKDEYVTRTVFIPLESIIAKGSNPATLAAVLLCPQRDKTEVTIHSIDFVKVKYDTPVTGITVTASKTELENKKSVTCKAAVAPETATRKTLKWSSSNEKVATVDFTGKVTAAASGSGIAVITVEATDGSGKKGTFEITVKEKSENPPVVQDISVPLTADTKYAAGCLETASGSACTPVYGADGSVTYTSSNQYNGGGMAFYFNKDKEAVDLSQYSGIRVVIKGTSGKGIKLTPYTNQTPDNHLNSKKIADDYGLTLDGTEQTYTLDFEKDEEAVKKWGTRGEAYAIGIVYNAYNESQGDNSYDKGNKLYCDITVKSVTLIKKQAQTPVEQDITVPLKATTKYAEGCLETASGSACTPVYGADGSVTYTSSNEYNGGGMAFYFNEDKEAVDLSEYAGIKVVIKGTSGKGIKLTPYTNQTPDNHLSSKKVADDYGLTLDGTEQTYILDFAKDEEAVKKWGARGEAYALGIVYNAYNESQGDNSYDKGNKLYCDITVKSVTLLKTIPTA